MKFVQIVDFQTERLEEMQQLVQEARQRTADRAGGPTHSMLLKDRDNPNRYLALIEFESYEDAMRNSNDPKTTRMAEQMSELSIGERTFTNCDLLEMSELK